MTIDPATSYTDGEGFIDQRTRVDRVFLSAIQRGEFRVNWNIRNATRQQYSTRSFPEAMFLTVRLIEEGHRPLLYAATYNSDALISARSYKSEDGRWVSRNEALADELQHYLDLWCEYHGLGNVPAPILQRLRPKRHIKRERL
jgi:hypothetical protein